MKKYLPGNKRPIRAPRWLGSRIGFFYLRDNSTLFTVLPSMSIYELAFANRLV